MVENASGYESEQSLLDRMRELRDHDWNDPNAPDIYANIEEFAKLFNKTTPEERWIIWNELWEQNKSRGFFATHEIYNNPNVDPKIRETIISWMSDPKMHEELAQKIADEDEGIFEIEDLEDTRDENLERDTTGYSIVGLSYPDGTSKFIIKVKASDPDWMEQIEEATIHFQSNVAEGELWDLEDNITDESRLDLPTWTEYKKQHGL